MTDTVLKIKGVRAADRTPPKAREPEQPAQTDGQEEPYGRQWTSSIPQVAAEDIIDIGNGRYAHFRRDRRFAQVQVVFTAPEGVDPDPGRELTDQFEEQGWTRWEKEPGKPWIYQLEQSSEDDPTARGDSRDALHEQFLIIIQEYRQKHGMPPTSGWRNLFENETRHQNPELDRRSSSSVADQVGRIREEQTPQSAEKETRAGGRAAGQAVEMLDAFASVGAERFDLTFTDIAREKIAFRSNQPLGQLRAAMPRILAHAEKRERNVIIRPRGPVIQLDDLGEAAVERLRPVSFLILRTSPGNYQAWVAVADADEDFARRLRKGAGADLTASGATRVSGSLNFKEKYMPAFPCVETVYTSPGRVVTQAELNALGVVAPEENVTPAVIRGHHSGSRGWPSYQQCLEHPKAQKEGRPDRSKADYTFCVLAIDWGWSVEETADRLMQVSSKAQENGESYVQRTVQNAAAAVERRQGQKR
ncbi:MAG TPA: DNA-primase RepB domain-containing protein [Gemmataceae bacterium]|nr:DNA-primase RepB domain-containing protein [Gemmataceae bacterium]